MRWCMHQHRTKRRACRRVSLHGRLRLQHGIALVLQLRQVTARTLQGALRQGCQLLHGGLLGTQACKQHAQHTVLFGVLLP